MKYLLNYIFVFTSIISSAYANCPSNSGSWIVSGIVKLKADDNKKIRLICDKITFLKNSKIIAYNKILIKTNELEGPVNIKTINGRKQSQFNYRTKDFINPMKNHSVLLVLNKFKLEEYKIDTSGFDGANGTPGMNGKDQDESMGQPKFGSNGGKSLSGQDAGDIHVYYNLEINEEAFTFKHFNKISENIDGGKFGTAGNGGLGGVYLNSNERVISGKLGESGKDGASGKILRYGSLE